MIRRTARRGARGGAARGFAAHRGHHAAPRGPRVAVRGATHPLRTPLALLHVHIFVVHLLHATLSEVRPCRRS